MKSELVERTCDALNTTFGKWSLLGVDDLTVPYYFDPRDIYSDVYDPMRIEYRHRFINDAVPIVMEIRENSKRELSTERIRSVFVWEEELGRYKDISKAMQESVWSEEVMFKSTIPKDFKYMAKRELEFDNDPYTVQYPRTANRYGESRWVIKYNFLPREITNITYVRYWKDTNFHPLQAALNVGIALPPTICVGPNQFKFAQDEIYSREYDVFKDCGYIEVSHENFVPRTPMPKLYNMGPPWSGLTRD